MKKGFTLIEVLVSTAIFTLVIIAFIGIFVTVAGVQVRQNSSAAVNGESQFLLQKIKYYIELSSFASSTQDLSTSTLTLRMPSSSIDPAVLSLSNGTVYLQLATGTPQPLSSNAVVVSNLLFTRRSNAPGHDSVNVSFTVSYNTSNIKQMVAQALQTSVARVSAATFDSNVLPSTAGTLNLGASGQTWASVNGILDFSGTNVGVNAASPQQALEVNGGVRLNTAIAQPTCNSSARGTLWFTESAPGANDALQICAENTSSTYPWLTVSNPWSASGTAIYYNSGNVGIGTAGPTQKLTVTGSILANNGFASSIGLSSGPSDAGSFAITSGYPGMVTTGAILGQNWVSNSGNSAMVQVNSSYNSSAIVFSSASSNYGGITFQQMNTSGSPVASVVINGGATPVANTLYVSGGNVGIGTPAPGAELDVETSSDANTNIARFMNPGQSTAGRYTYVNFGKSAVAGGVSEFGFVENTVTPANSWAFFGTPYGLSEQTASLVVSGNGYVGIGKTNPSTALDVSGTITGTTKNFEIPYPGGEMPGYDLVHSTIEGPEIAVFYRGTAQLVNNQATITLPSYFGALTRSGSETVYLTAKGNAPFSLSYDSFNHEAGTFVVHGSVPSGSFDWQVEATRADVPPLQVVKPTPGK
jgi:prepilin-type N-terminal cleavage/methylation domain-containing protein